MSSTTRAAGERPPVEVFGIRHHGPGSARSLVAALADYQPDAVLIEGPRMPIPCFIGFCADGMTPPLALLGYAPDHPQTAAFWPYASSPRVAGHDLRAAARHRRGFCDLPASAVLARWPRRQPPDDDLDDRTMRRPKTRSGPLLEQHDPLAVLAQAAGYDDPERWWDDLVESRLDSSSPFPMITDAMAELRMIMDQTAATRSGRPGVRRTCASRSGRLSSAVGNAWPWSAAPGTRLCCAGRRRRRPPTSGRCGGHLDARSLDLGAVDASAACLRHRLGPGSLARLVSPSLDRSRSADRALAGQVAQALRVRDLPVSSAHVIEAVRLAETLASLRGRPLAGLTEVTEATRAVLCDGDELAVRYVTDHLVVGRRSGRSTTVCRPSRWRPTCPHLPHIASPARGSTPVS